MTFFTLFSSVFLASATFAQQTTPTPSDPVDKPVTNPDVVTPGMLGFMVILVLSITVIILGISSVRRIRRIQYRHDAETAQATAHQDKDAEKTSQKTRENTIDTEN